jgi:hypothetical protein
MFEISYVTRTVHFDRTSVMRRPTKVEAIRLFKLLRDDSFVASIELRSPTGRLLKKLEK